MQFSVRLPIATHMLLCIERFRGEQKATSEFLAGSVNVNPVIIRKIMGQLKSAGLVEVAPGVGGARLTRDPEDITLLDVFRAVEEESTLFALQRDPNPACPVGKNIHRVLGGHLDRARDAMLDSLGAVTLASLLEEIRASETACSERE